MEEDKFLTDDPDVLVIAGGAVKGISILGALQYAYDNHRLDKIRTMVGTSIGAILNYLLAIGYTPIDIFLKVLKEALLEKIHANINFRSIEEGMLSYAFIQDVLEKLTIDKIGYFPTLKDIQNKFNKKLVITTYNLTKDVIEYLNPDDNPELPCLTALRMTSNIPFLFDQFKYMGCYYVDGGIADNFPIEIATKYGEHVIGFYTVENNTTKILEKNKIVSYILNLLFIMPRIRVKEVMEKYKSKCSFVKIADDVQMFNFNIEIKDRLELFSTGYNAARNTFEVSSNSS